MIKVLLWDIDGTLLDFLAAEKCAIRKCFEIYEMGECTDEMLSAYSAINTKYWQMLERNEMTKPQILVGRFREFFERYGLDAEKAEAFNGEYQVRLGDYVVFTEGALETVTALKGKVLQYAVTNGTKVAQDKKLKVSGLGEIFDHVFISEVIGCEKPNLGFFDKVFEVIGEYAPEEVMIVGDSLTSDIKGGVNAGILTCYFNPKGKAVPEAAGVDYDIRTVSQVLQICEERAER